MREIESKVCNVCARQDEWKCLSGGGGGGGILV